MAFFDKKEETLDLKLTPYGRYLLSVGKLNPKYYSFLDDDIIYDTQAADFTESNNEVKQRIINETPSLKPLTTFNSVEETIGDNFVTPEGKILEILEEQGKITMQEKLTSNNTYKSLSDINSKFLQYTIGTSDSLHKKAPSWNIINFSGEITKAANGIISSVSESAEYINDIDTPSIDLNIPQVDIDIEYKLSVGSTSDAEHDSYMQSFESAELLTPKIYSDGTYLKIEEDQLLSRILEDNGFEFNEAFDIQVFTNRPEIVGNTSNNWKKLKFKNKPKRIVKDILLDEEDQFYNPLDITEDIVEFYFNLRVDEEIPLRDICKNASNLEGFEKELYELGIDVEIDCKDLIATPGTPTTTDECLPDPCAEES